MKLKFRLLKILVCLVLLLVMMNFALKRYNNAPFSEYQIQLKDQNELAFVDHSTIKSTIKNIYSHKDTIQIKDLSIHNIESKIKENPYVDSVNIYLDQNKELNVYVSQKQPIARVNTEKEQFYLSTENERIPISNTYSKKCLLVEGKIDSTEYEKINQLATYIDMDNLLKKHIVGVRKQRDKSFILLVNRSEFFIEFGTLDNIPTKFEKLKAFYDQYLNHVGLKKYSKISLKYDNQIVATKR